LNIVSNSHAYMAGEKRHRFQIPEIPTPSKTSKKSFLRIIADSGCTDHLLNISPKYFRTPQKIHNIISTAGSGTLTSTLLGDVGPLKNAQYCSDVTKNLCSIYKICAEDKVVLFTDTAVVSFDKAFFAYQGIPDLTGGCRNGLYYFDIPLEPIVDPPPTGSSSKIEDMEGLTTRSALITSAIVDNKCTMWHCKLGHLNIDYMNKLRSTGLIQGMDWTSEEELRHQQTLCPGCALGKMRAMPTRRISRGIHVPRYKVDSPGTLIMVDLFFSDIHSLRNRHTVGLIICDCYSRMCWTYSMLHKDEAPSRLKEWIQHMARLKVNIKNFGVIRSDNGGEFTDVEFKTVLTEFHINHERVPPHTHVQTVERCIGIHKENARSMIETHKINLSRAAMWGTSGKNSNPFAFWPQAMAYSCQTAGLMLNKERTMTRHQMFYGHPPDISRYKTFGCIAYILTYSTLRQTWDSTSTEAIFIGFNQESPKTWILFKLDTAQYVDHASCVFNENTSPQTIQHVSEYTAAGKKNLTSKRHRAGTAPPPSDTGWSTRTRSAQTTHETLLAMESSSISNTLSFPPDLEMSSELTPEEEVELDRKDELSYVHDPDKLLGLAPQSFPGMETAASSDALPRSYHEAMRIPAWRESVIRELNSLKQCNIMDIIHKDDLPARARPLDWTFVFKIKTDLNTGVKTYKSRATIRGGRQVAGIDYEETFAPVVRLKTLRVLLALAALHGWHVHGMDVDTAFLNGEIAEGDIPVYVKIPPGYDGPGTVPGKTKSADCYGRLLKHVYGLKQAPRTWNGTLHNYLLSLGFTPTAEDVCLYMRTSSDGTVAYAAVFVDDLVLASPTLDEVLRIKQQLNQKWKMKDLGELSSILGMKVTRDWRSGTISLSQEKYAADVLERFNMSDCRPASTPMSPGVMLSRSMSPPPGSIEEQECKKYPYREVVGSLMYLAQCTMPKMAFAVSQLSRFGSCYGKSHIAAALHALRYLKGAMHEGITFGRGGVAHPVGFSDASYASCPDTGRSVTGHVFFVGGGPVVWKSKLQSSVALSSFESEYMAVGDIASEGLHLGRLVKSILGAGYYEKQPVDIFEDNLACLAMAKNPVLHEKQKHIRVRYHFIRECVLRRQLAVHFIGTNSMVADLLTKPVPVSTLRVLGPALNGLTDLYEHVRQYIQLPHLRRSVDSLQQSPEDATVA
jgi:hypothetical protein